MSNTENYVFISYAHRDAEVVLPILDAMRRSGINLWYDEGIAAGSEWPEYIAEKVVNCTRFMLFISNSYLDSQNCKRELNFAVSRRKDILSIYLEDVQLSPGMELQLGTYQAFFKKRYSGPEEFCNALCKESFFQCCMTDQPQPPIQIPVQQPPVQPAQPAQPAPQPARQVAREHSTIADPLIPPTPRTTTPPAPQQDYTISHSTTDGEATLQLNKAPQKSRKTALLLALILGLFGAHKFYLGQKGWGIGYLVVTLINLSAGAFPILILVGLFDAYRLYKLPAEEFEKKYKCKAVD